ncbi:uncharacterized protein LOC135353209 [Latimeria chalumnae]|uniref:uncharacterized protein LOC135353209 n=1 Tax=Latimeria chalumnae TaxID=7897 RepID=UPI00313D7034
MTVTSALLVICGSLPVIVCVFSSVFTLQFYRKRQRKGGKSKASAGISDAIYQEIDPNYVAKTLENFPVPGLKIQDAEFKDSVSELDYYNEDGLEEISLGLPSDRENTPDIPVESTELLSESSPSHYDVWSHAENKKGIKIKDSFITLTGSLISRAVGSAMYSNALEKERETSKGRTDKRKPRTGAVLNQSVNTEQSVVSGMKNSDYDDVECLTSDNQSHPEHGHSDYDDVEDVPLNGSAIDKADKGKIHS